LSVTRGILISDYGEARHAEARERYELGLRALRNVRCVGAQSGFDGVQLCLRVNMAAVCLALGDARTAITVRTAADDDDEQRHMLADKARLPIVGSASSIWSLPI
jgi:hypothetical protein